MNVFFLVATLFASMFAFSFLFAGIVTLLALDEVETGELRRRIEEIPPGWARPFRTYQIAKVNGYSLSHWHDRPQARRYLQLGAVFFLLAILLGQFATIPR